MRWMLIPLMSAMVGCSLTPRLSRAPMPVPDRYPQEVGRASLEGGPVPGWREVFLDPRLRALVELALVHNRDLRLATLNVEAVAAQYRIQRSAALPSLDAAAGRLRQRTPGPALQDSYSLNAGISAFELDLFGRVRSLSEAAFARFSASEQGRRAAEIVLVAGVADAYLAERLAVEEERLSARTLEDWRATLALTRHLKAADQCSGLDLAQAEGQVAAAEADLEGRRRSAMQARNALRLLVGTEPPKDLPEGLSLEDPMVLEALPEGLPSDLLLRRPDILQAEQQLVAANAEIGAARAAFFPRLTLTASAGEQSPTFRGLFEGANRVWSFAPQITAPLFQGGRLRAEKRLAELRKSSAIVEYERSIQVAFREVADGLAGRRTFGVQIAAQRKAVEAAEWRTGLALLRYRAGVEGRLELLDAQRQGYATRLALLELRRSAHGNAVALYKALGGGLSVP